MKITDERLRQVVRDLNKARNRHADLLKQFNDDWDALIAIGSAYKAGAIAILRKLLDEVQK